MKYATWFEAVEEERRSIRREEDSITNAKREGRDLTDWIWAGHVKRLEDSQTRLRRLQDDLNRFYQAEVERDVNRLW